jgi:hypothetical protein
MCIHGTRVEDDSLKDDPFRPGAYGRVLGIQTPGEWDWAGCTPNGHLGNFAAHDVIEHEDGTITVSPSILVEGYDWKKKEERQLWHGYLEHGDWRQC